MDLRRKLMMGMVQSTMFKKIEKHSVTISGITNSASIPSSVQYTINHNIGEVPDFVLLYPKKRFIPEHRSSTFYVINYMMYINVGATHRSGAFYDATTTMSTNYIRGDNGNGGTNAGATTWINNITNASIQLGGTALYNIGIVNGDYWCVIGKLSDDYLQGEQEIYSE